MCMGCDGWGAGARGGRGLEIISCAASGCARTVRACPATWRRQAACRRRRYTWRGVRTAPGRRPRTRSAGRRGRRADSRRRPWRVKANDTMSRVSGAGNTRVPPRSHTSASTRRLLSPRAQRAALRTRAGLWSGAGGRVGCWELEALWPCGRAALSTAGATCVSGRRAARGAAPRSLVRVRVRRRLRLRLRVDIGRRGHG